MARKAKRVGRPSGFTAKLGAKLCDLLSEGRSVLAISKMAGMPPESTIRGWAHKAESSSDAFFASYARAREMGADHEFDKLEEIEADLRDGNIESDVARVLLDSIKWRLAKKMPRLYGDRQHVEHSGEVKMSPKDHAPEWMVERLTGKGTEAPTASDEDEDTIIH